MGYVIVGIAAFALGISLTLLCLHLRETRQSDLIKDKTSRQSDKIKETDELQSENK